MAYQGVVDDFRSIRKLRIPKRVPCVALSEEFDVKWHGQYSYETFCQDGAKMAEVLGAAVEHFDYDWAWVQVDDCFEFEPIGVGVTGAGNILRATHQYLPVGADTLAQLPVLDPRRDGRMPAKLTAIRQLRQRFGETVLITGSCGAPFSAVGLTWGIENLLLIMLDDPPLLRAAMDYWLRFYKRYIEAQRDAGAHAIWLGDCNAFSELLPLPLYNEHVLPMTRDLVQYCENELEIMIWMHNSEIKRDHVLAHLPLGLSFESIGPAADIREIRAATQGRLAISGNLDPIEVLWRGTPATIAQDVERIMNICKPGGGYIFNTGEMNPRDIPAENMLAMMQAAKAHARY